jgi:hypothetical protein
MNISFGFPWAFEGPVQFDHAACPAQPEAMSRRRACCCHQSISGTQRNFLHAGNARVNCGFASGPPRPFRKFRKIETEKAFYAFTLEAIISPSGWIWGEHPIPPTNVSCLIFAPRREGFSLKKGP